MVPWKTSLLFHHSKTIAPGLLPAIYRNYHDDHDEDYDDQVVWVGEQRIMTSGFSGNEENGDDRDISIMIMITA